MDLDRMTQHMHSDEINWSHSYNSSKTQARNIPNENLIDFDCYKNVDRTNGMKKKMVSIDSGGGEEECEKVFAA